MTSPLYLDTSALIKLYIKEPGSVDVKTAVEAASRLGSSWLAFVETDAAISRAAQLAPGEKREILFATYDGDLKAAARKEGLKVLWTSAGQPTAHRAPQWPVALRSRIRLGRLRASSSIAGRESRIGGEGHQGPASGTTPARLAGGLSSAHAPDPA